MIGHTGHNFGLVSNMFLDNVNQIGFTFAINGYEEERKSNTTSFPELEERIYKIIYNYVANEY